MARHGKEGEQEARGMESLHFLKSTSPPFFLSPSPSLSETARSASSSLFSALLPSCPKSPFDHLLVDGFDAEQIWHQIDLQSRPLISNLRREIKRLEANPAEISRFLGGNSLENAKREETEGFLERNGGEERHGKGDGDEDGSDDEDEENEGFGEENGGTGEEEDEDEEEEEDDEGDDGGGSGGIEDRFLKIRELEEFLEKDEAREYGSSKEKREDRSEEDDDEDDEEGDEEEDADGEEDDADEMGGFNIEASGNDGADNLENIRYEDFFGGKKKKSSKKLKSFDGSEELSIAEKQEDDKGTLSTHEKELQKIRSTIEQMEKENLETKAWTMQGEVTASKRPKNSALEVDLDFEHNVRPPPVITEEVTASLEELITKRIIEGHFDDVQRAPSLPSKAPKELKELDENKSQKGLAEIYEEEYAQKTGLASAPLSFTDEQKKEASLLFKKLCLKLDALSHFHFTPKPIIEDMSIQANVPALAMEEIAPLAVSDAAMLAPEEVFSGKGDIKEDVELTQAERKRRRANKKRKFKAETVKRMAAKKARQNPALNDHSTGKDDEL
ncbi:M phase phosphoprotein 10 [Magnolia sinica]|uniref:M phase phosphoprotein 10 n=1 Tax=Magnolia sinica TaxID=86752 RepID=UPI002658869A|nr:M phase phosphoprotein 10 [Magnolia sinica]